MTPDRRALVRAAAWIAGGLLLLAAPQALSLRVSLPDAAARAAVVAACGCQVLGLLAVVGARRASRARAALVDLLDVVVVAVVLATWARRAALGTSAVLPAEGAALGPAALAGGIAVVGLCLWVLVRGGGRRGSALPVPGPSARQPLVLAAAVTVPAGAALGGDRPAVVLAWAAVLLGVCVARAHLVPGPPPAIERRLGRVLTGVQP